MAKKRGLATNRGLDALLGSIKKEKLIAGNLSNASIATEADSMATENSDNSLDTPSAMPSSVGKATNTKLKLENAGATPSNKPQQTVVDLDISDDMTADNATINDTLDSKLNLLHMDVTALQRGKYQPRLDLGEEALQELATSIKQHGVMQPIVIRPLAKTAKNSPVTHEIIAGERRWRAAQIAGLTHIPAIIRPMSDDLAIALALIENIQREDLSVMEQATALQRFHDEFGMSHAQIADVVGKARTTVSNLLRLNQLHDEVKNALNDGLMDMGHARALLSLSIGQQPVIARKIVNEQLTVRQTEQLVKDILDPKHVDKPSKELDFERLRLNQQLSEQLGAVVKVKGSSSGKGSIEIFFHNSDELQALLQQLQIQ